ncbi:hypothetical protein HAX54_031488 [Datura stramonium]|uniref:Uncharacterized protein n=1 Tax=Datura stramonium TaxID=4076 RepID=A0ABS8VAM4_DATST|nr:hypothetical protein [Datura stramonium]
MSELPCPRDQQRGAQPHLLDQRREAPACPRYQPRDVLLSWRDAAQQWRDGMCEAQLIQRDGMCGTPSMFKRPTDSNPTSTRKRSYKSQIKSAKEQGRHKSIINLLYLFEKKSEVLEKS